MPVATYLNDLEVRRWASVPDDPDFDDILQKLRAMSGENWLCSVHTLRVGRWRKKVRKMYTLYSDAHGEWQIINLLTPAGGSVFAGCTREDVMNFMMGMINGMQWEQRKQRKQRER